MAKTPSYKDFKPFQKDSGRTFTYRANSDGVNKELGPKVVLPPKPKVEGKKGAPLAKVPLPQGKRGAPLPKVPLPEGKRGLPLAKKPLPEGKRGLPLAKAPLPQGKRGLPLPTTTGGSYGDWPLAKFSFVVNVGGLTGEMAFQGMDGLGASVGKMEFRDGNSSKFYKQTRPTLTSYDPVTLKKGMFVGDTKLFDWFKNVSQGSMFSDMRTVTITLCELVGNKPQHIFTWTLEKAYITKFTPSGLDGEADTEPAVEEIELTYQSFSMEAGEGGLLGSLMGAASGLLGTVTGALSGSISGSISF